MRDVHQLKGPLIGADLHQHGVVPGHDGDDQEHRDDVEDPHSPHHGIGGTGDLLGGVFRLGSGNGDNFGSHETEHGGEHGTDDSGHAVGHETTKLMTQVDHTAN